MSEGLDALNTLVLKELSYCSVVLSVAMATIDSNFMEQPGDNNTIGIGLITHNAGAIATPRHRRPAP